MQNEICHEDYLIHIATQEQFFSFLHKKYDWADRYIYYYVYIAYVERNSVEFILDRILEKDRYKYSPQKAYDYLKAYEKTRLDLAVIIPTCNRPKAIEYLLNLIAIAYRRYGIDMIIFDSSTDDKTEKVVKKVRSNGYLNVIYDRYDGLFDGFSLDHKIVSAYQKYSSRYEYIWMCRDGLIPVVDDMLDRLRFFFKNKVDCIIVDTKSRNQNVEIEKYYSSIEDCNQLLKDQASRLQTLGMLIFSNRLIKKLIKYEPINEKNYSLWQMAAPFHLFAKEPYQIVFFTKNVFAENICASPTHFWSKASKVFEQWAYRWYNVIMNMPDVYNEAKEDCLMIYTIDFHPFTPRSLLEMRGWGGLSFRLVNQYKEYISKVTLTPVKLFYFASLTPKCISKFLYKLVLKNPQFFGKLRDKLTKQNGGRGG